MAHQNNVLHFWRGIWLYCNVPIADNKRDISVSYCSAFHPFSVINTQFINHCSLCDTFHPSVGHIVTWRLSMQCMGRKRPLPDWIGTRLLGSISIGAVNLITTDRFISYRLTYLCEINNSLPIKHWFMTSLRRTNEVCHHNRIDLHRQLHRTRIMFLRRRKEMRKQVQCCFLLPLTSNWMCFGWKWRTLYAEYWRTENFRLTMFSVFNWCTQTNYVW